MISLAALDMVAKRYDASERFSEQMTTDMNTVRIGPDTSMAGVAKPAYFEPHNPPILPHDLIQHLCVNQRLPNSGGLWFGSLCSGWR